MTKRKSQLPSSTPEELATEIILLRNHYPHHAIVILEGPTDRALFAEFVANTCELIPTGGKDKAIRALAIVERRNVRGILAILDADFWLLEQEDLPVSQNLVFTDVTDMEVMLFMSPALEKVLRHTVSNIDSRLIGDFGERLRAKTLDIGLVTGYLRWVDYRNRDYNLSIKKLTYDEIIDFENFTLDEEIVVRQVTSSTQFKPRLVEAILNEISMLKTRHPSPSHICRGHDLLAITATILPLLTIKELRITMSEKQIIQTQAGLYPIK